MRRSIDFPAWKNHPPAFITARTPHISAFCTVGRSVVAKYSQERNYYYTLFISISSIAFSFFALTTIPDSGATFTPSQAHINRENTFQHSANCICYPTRCSAISPAPTRTQAQNAATQPSSALAVLGAHWKTQSRNDNRTKHAREAGPDRVSSIPSYHHLHTATPQPLHTYITTHPTFVHIRRIVYLVLIGLSR